MAASWELYDAPDMLSAISSPLAGGRREVLLAADGVHCAGCIRGVERALFGLADRLQVNLASRTVEFSFDPERQPLSTLIERLDRAGYRPRVMAQESSLLSAQRERRAALARVGVAVICAMQVMMLAWPEYFDAGQIEPGVLQLLHWTQWLLATPAVFYCGWPFLVAAWQSLRLRSLGMDVPVAASILVAYGASAWRTVDGQGHLYFDAATMFVMLLGAGRYLEGRSRAQAGERLRQLAGRRALVATRIESGQPKSVAIALLEPGDRVRVAPGEVFPSDGVLLDAAADLDESVLTGESQPVRHSADSAVLAGCINVGSNAVDIRVSTAAAATRLAAITRLQREAERYKPPMQLLADRIAGRFVLAVLLLAAAGFAWWWPRDPAQALDVLLAVLVVSCPCALSLAIPSVYAAASSRLAKAGLLLVHPAVLARLPRLTHVLFDKTGTLTYPDLQLAEVRPLGGLSEVDALRIAAALEQDFQHPIARALVEATAHADRADHVELAQGGGVQGAVAGRRYWLGPPEQLGLDASSLPVLGEGRHTWVALACEGEPMALFGLLSKLRPQAAATVARLREDSVNVRLISGDSEAAVAQLASQLDVDQAFWRHSPEQKLDQLRRLQRFGFVVMAVGDGINDAPLLAAADIGVALSSGAALAQTRADVILVGDSLGGLNLLREVAETAAIRVNQNLAWALIYNLVMLPLALTGTLTPWIAALGMSLSSLLVMTNALRLGARRPEPVSFHERLA